MILSTIPHNEHFNEMHLLICKVACQWSFPPCFSGYGATDTLMNSANFLVSA